MVKRVVLLVVAGILLVVSAALGLAAAWGYSALGPDGVMRFGLGTITPDSTAQATIIDVDRYSLSIPYIQSLGTVTLEATTGETGDPSDVLFLGAAATPDVDSYLRGTPYSVAVRVGDEWQTRQVPGSGTAAPAREQAFWLAAAVGREPAIQVPDQRPLTLVVTHPAGLPTGPFALRFGFTVPDAPTWILVMAAVAAVLLIVAIVLVIIAFRVKTAPRRRGKHEAEPVEDGVPVAAGAAPADVAPAGAAPADVAPEPEHLADEPAQPPAEPVTEVLPATAVEAQPEPEAEPAPPSPVAVDEPSSSTDDEMVPGDASNI